MKAMVFAAGLGTRLKPLTDSIPKCLARAGGKTLLDHCLERLWKAGVADVVINLHYRGEQVRDHLREHPFPGLKVHFSPETELLETGGGLYRVRDFFAGETDFLVCNSDIYTELDLTRLVAAHRKAEALATLAVATRKTRRYLLFDTDLRLQGWMNRSTGEEFRWNETPVQERAFQGLQVLSPGIFNHMQDRGDHFSTIPVYLDAARSGAGIRGFDMSGVFWMDIGTPEKLSQLDRRLGSG